MTMTKELKIGKRYALNGIVYEVREHTSELQQCRDCAFYISEDNECADSPYYKMGHCSACMRSDDKDVVFVKVGETDAQPTGEVREMPEL